jgi:hypothetical protein
MKYLRLVGIALLAIVALSAVAANAASAAEVSALITYSGTGAFTITSGPGKLETSGKLEISCKADNGKGQLAKTQAFTAELTVTFTLCEALGKKCTSEGLTAGNIQTVRLLGTLGRIGPGKAGILLTSASNPGGELVVAVKCGTIAFKATGSVIGELTPVDKQTKTLTAVFNQKGGLQEVKHFENVAGNDNLIAELGGGPEEAGLQSEETLTLEGTGSGILLA